MAHLAWTDEMGNLANDPAREAQTRRAVEAATNYLSHLPAQAERPVWNLNAIAATPRNDTARAMGAAITATLAGLEGVELQKTLAVAVRWAYFVVNNGTAGVEYADGWTALGTRVRELAIKQADPRGARGMRREVRRGGGTRPGGGPVIR